MEEQELELAVGDAVSIGEYTVTVIDIDGPEVHFRVDFLDADELVVGSVERAARPGK